LGEGLDLLRQAIAALLGEDLFVGTFRLPQPLGRLPRPPLRLGAGAVAAASSAS
ncbi:hypothetical protein I4945_19840, partial [Pseudomonas aeruginosa]|nr:hypothetical protein [Pseudomonas aeruginosa]